MGVVQIVESVAKLGRFARCNELPAAHDTAAVRDGKGTLGVLLDEQDRDTGCGRMLEGGVKAVDDLRGQAERQLVGNQ